MIIKIIRKIKNFIKSCSITHKKITYNCGGFEIKLSKNHLLPFYQKKYKNYDRFLPHLAKHLKQNDLVVDIGANCGDTLASMIGSNSTLQYICIEADTEFFQLLEENIHSIKSKINVSITPIQALVGYKVTAVTLTGKGGTKKAIKKSSLSDSELLHSKTLDQILKETPKDESIKLKLIKSDIDGFDYDALNSAAELITKNKPIIYFECDYTDEEQKKEYLNTIKNLMVNGHDNFFFFDNFGEFVMQANCFQQIENLLNYTWRQTKYNSTRTIYYFDILCCCETDLNLANSIVSSYTEIVLCKN